MTESNPAPDATFTTSPQSIPLPGTSFVGRVHDMAIIDAMITSRDIRLLTLVGPGGVGKTRLAVELALQWQHSSDFQLVFVSLENITADISVGDVIARTLRIDVPPERDPIVGLTSRIGAQNMLLMLDNLEHLPDAPLVVAQILSRCAGMTVLATSRAALDIRGEHLYPVAPLETHPAGDAVRLFLDRARMLVPGFKPSSQNLERIVHICQLLDGLPLAIELAAAQSMVLTPDAILTRIETYHPLPLPGPRDAPVRLRTLQNAIAWSYDLLSEGGRRLFRRLSVFEGDFGLDTVDVLCSKLAPTEAGLAKSDPVQGLSELIGNSLLTPYDGEQEQQRFSMLRTIRSFASDRLAETDESASVKGAFADLFLDLAEDLQWAWIVGNGQRLEVEHANLQGALAWFDNTSNAPGFIRLVTALSGFWYVHSYDRVASMWQARAWEMVADVPDRLRGRLHIARAMLTRLAGDPSHIGNEIATGMSLLDPTSDVATLAVASIWRGAIAQKEEKNDRAAEFLTAALQLAHQVDDPTLRAALRARALSNLAVAADGSDDLVQAARFYDTAIQLYTLHGPLPGLARALAGRGAVAFDTGNYDEALDYFRACIQSPDARADRPLLIFIFEHSADIATQWQQPGRASRLLHASRTLKQELDHPGNITASSASRPATTHEAPFLEGAMNTTASRHQERAHMIELAISDVQLLAKQTTPGALPEEGAGSFTEREVDILLYLVAGYSNRDIAEELFLSIRTVESHVLRVYRKLNVKTRTAAVTKIITLGLVDVEAALNHTNRQQ